MRGDGFIYRHPGSRFWWMEYSHKGKVYRQSTRCVKPKAAQNVLRAIIDSLRKSSASSTLLVADLYKSVQLDYEVNRRKSIRDLKSRWGKHLAKVFAALPATSVSAKDVKAYTSKRLEEKAAPATVNRELALLKRMYMLATKDDILKIGEGPKITMLKEDNVRVGFVTDPEYAALARETGKIGLWLRTLFELGYTIGWRKSELLGLKVSQVDMLDRKIVLHAGKTKNDKARSAPMTAAVFDLLAALTLGKLPDDYVFTRLSKSGKVRPIAGFRKAWAKATAAAGCPDRLFHDLRRTGVRNLVRAGVGENTAMKITGLRTRSIFDRYDIVNEADKDRAIEMLEKDKSDRDKRQQYEQAELLLDAPRKPS